MVRAFDDPLAFVVFFLERRVMCSSVGQEGQRIADGAGNLSGKIYTSDLLDWFKSRIGASWPIAGCWESRRVDSKGFATLDIDRPSESLRCWFFFALFWFAWGGGRW